MKDLEIICPHCKFSYKEDSIDYTDGEMEGEFPMDCEECKKPFIVKFETTINYLSAKK